MNKKLFAAFALVITMLGITAKSTAQDYNALAECTKLSPVLDDIHACLDNYLDVMDGSIAGITDFLARSLSGDELAGLDRSQQAFVEYRRQNCLWYLDFSSPRVEAEQIAKNCLASMSQQRLQELQKLVGVEDESGQVLRGFYVYGPDRNSFQVCGSDKRYWVEGDNVTVSRIQQLYLSLATSELQVMHVVIAGSIDAQAQSPSDHQGVLQLDTLIEMSLPAESDCRLPGEQVEPDTVADDASNELALDETENPEEEEQEEPEQQLIAYFGAWVVDCVENKGLRLCNLVVEFDHPAGTDSVDKSEVVTLELLRQKQSATSIEVMFPNREIDSPSRIRWNIDALEFGDVVGSEIRVDEVATRQLIPAGRFLRNDLLPMMLKGAQLQIEVLASVDDASGEQFNATLNGLTKALSFADTFVRDSGS